MKFWENNDRQYQVCQARESQRPSTKPLPEHFTVSDSYQDAQAV
jgi:hypothetical protein